LGKQGRSSFSSCQGHSSSWSYAKQIFIIAIFSNRLYPVGISFKTDKAASAIDVSMSFLKYCLRKAE
jgi:hypothetical protein